MHVEERPQKERAKARVDIFRVWEPGKEARKKPKNEHPRQVEHIGHTTNQRQHGWGHIAARTIGLGQRNYRVAAIYMEFENVSDPADPVTIPSFGPEEGIEYYQDLASSTDRDFLRLPLAMDPTLGIASGFENSFTEGESGNQLTYAATSQGTAGFHGKDFSNAANSKVFGAALVATPEFADPLKDIIFARAYYDVADQTVKLASSQISMTWSVPFTV